MLFGIEKIESIGKFSFLKYLPSNNFNLTDKIFPLNNYFNTSVGANPIFSETTLQFSLIIISIYIISSSIFHP